MSSSGSGGYTRSRRNGGAASRPPSHWSPIMQLNNINYRCTPDDIQAILKSKPGTTKGRLVKIEHEKEAA